MNLTARLANQWRSIPAIATVLAVVLVLAGVATIFFTSRANQQQRMRESAIQTQIFAASVTAALDFGDRQAAEDHINALRVNPQILSASVYDSRGRPFAGFGQAAANAALVEAPVMRGRERIGTVRLTMQRDPLSRRAARYMLVIIFVVMAALVVMVLAVAAAAMRRANRELADRAEALADANRALEVQIEERANAEEQLRQSQKMQALGQLTGGIAHDFNNLLTVIQGSADMLQRPNLPADKRARFAAAIVQTAARAAALTSQLLAFARRQPLQPEAIDLSARIADMAELLDRTLGERVEVRTDLAPGLGAVEADPAQLEAAILNVAVNARDAMPGGGTLTIRTAAATLSGQPAIALSLSDTGQGIDPDTLERVFEPFFTTKAVGKGTGLGLSQVYGFANQSGGEVRIDSAPGAGTTITLLLPRSAAVVPQAASAVAAAIRGNGPGGRLLVVDDNEEVGAFAETLLAELGHKVTRARSGEEAIDIFHEWPFDAIFTDVVMPGMSGLELADKLRAARPDLPIILTTGYSDEIAESGTGGLPVVFKPYRLEALAAAVDRALART